MEVFNIGLQLSLLASQMADIWMLQIKIWQEQV